MVEQMDVEGFGGCTLYGECQEACPKEISIDTIARMNRDYLRAAVTARCARRRPSRTEPALALALALARAGRGDGAGRSAQIWAQRSARRPVVGATSGRTPCPGGGSLGEVRVVQPVAACCTPARWRPPSPHRRCSISKAPRSRGRARPGQLGRGLRRPPPSPHLRPRAHPRRRRSARRTDGAARLSLSAGKGFAPFGTDDPMVRPFLRYPVNHHLAQILERAVAIAAVRAGPLLAEAGLFNGDEPERPGQWPRIGGRFGDSWSGAAHGPLRSRARAPGLATRTSIRPSTGPGPGPTRTSGASRPGGRGRSTAIPVYGLVEWARTSEADGFFVFHSVLAEGAWSTGPHRLQYRFERTERPEEERIATFRSLRPHLENSILGITRWTIHTVGYEVAALRRSAARGAAAGGSIVRAASPRSAAGCSTSRSCTAAGSLWSLSARGPARRRGAMHRMGRYGARRTIG